jgi:putative acetyltransferase
MNSRMAMPSPTRAVIASTIRIIPFEKKYQQCVQDLFIECLGGAYANRITPAAHAVQKNFVKSKINESGDMYNIYESFMSSSPSEAKGFYIAIDDRDRVVGHVGIIPSTYAARHAYIYDEALGLAPENVCELVRMGVHEDTRGKGVGRLLCEQVETFARSKGMKRIALSTLSEMDLALGLYSKCGYSLVRETELELDKVLGEGHSFTTAVRVSHLVKDL